MSGLCLSPTLSLSSLYLKKEKKTGKDCMKSLYMLQLWAAA